MRAVMAIPNLNGGGAEKMAVNLAKRLNAGRVRIRLFVHERWGDLVDSIEPELDVVYQNEGHYKRLHLPKTIIGHLKHTRDADVVIGANEGRAAFTSLICAKLRRKPLILWIHNDWSRFSRKVSWRQRLVLKQYPKADVIVACSKGAAEAFKTLVPSAAGKIRTIYNGIDLPDIRQRCEEALPEVHEHLFRDPVVIAVARLDYQKGLDLLIAAHAALIKRGHRHRLVILGSGPLRQDLEQQTRALGVENSVHLLGFVRNPFSYIARSRVFCLSSRFEGFSIATAEALACGTAVVASDCPSGPRELLSDGEFGILVAPDSAQALADGLERVLCNDEERLHLARRAVERAQVFDLSSVTEAWEELIENLVQPRQPSIAKGSSSAQHRTRA